MQIVDKRVKNLYGEGYGLAVTCVPNELTRVTLRVPADGAARVRGAAVGAAP
jgi:two-component system LytT family sensor kinase